MEKNSMDELPFLVVLIRRLRTVAVWILAIIFAVLLYFDFTEDEYVAAVLTSVFTFLIFVIVVTIIFKKFFLDNSKDKE
jgi:membrane protein YdbS with pleckstrin-like domain